MRFSDGKDGEEKQIEGFDCYCVCCGIAMKEKEIGYMIYGIRTDFIKRIMYEKETFSFCEECRNKIVENSICGLEGAVKKRKELDASSKKE